MRQFITITFLAFAVCSKGQINVISRNSKPTSKPYVVSYDSLTNIKELRDDSINFHQSFKHLIGQTIYYVAPDSTKSRVHHKAFYSTPEIRYGNPSIPRATCMNRYWKISDIVIQKSRYGGADKEIFELTDTTDGKKVYCESRNMNRDFIVLGYYEKIKKMYVGKTYIYQHTFYSDVWDNDRYNYLINFQTKKYNKDIPENTVWKCIDIAAYNITNQESLYDDYESRSPIILIFENDSLGKYYAYVENKIGRPFNDPIQDTKYCFWPQNKGHEEERLPLFLGKFLSPTQKDYIVKREAETKQYFAAQKKRMISKYGKYWGKLVAEGQLEIGMTKQMCRDSWGEPESINRTSTQYGNHEQWVYTTIYVYFDNGKISAIQDR